MNVNNEAFLDMGYAIRFALNDFPSPDPFDLDPLCMIKDPIIHRRASHP